MPDPGDPTDTYVAPAGETMLPSETLSGTVASIRVSSQENGHGTVVPVGEGGPAYRLLRVIGRGGMGEVWEAVQVSLGRVVAIKRVRAEADVGTEAERSIRAADFAREAIIAGRLEHPNIIPVHDLGLDEDGYPILSMKLVEGSPWDGLLKEDLKVLSPADLLAKHIPTLIGMVQAVAFAHSRGIVHRDLKPAQVMVGEFGEVMLTDWGLAILMREARRPIAEEHRLRLPTTETATSPSGTPALMAPEQTRSTAAGIGPWTDIFLLGGTLYYLLTGTFPYEADTMRNAIERAATGAVVPPSQRAPGRDIPLDLEMLAMRCLAVDPARRPVDAAEVLQGLRDFLSGTGRRKESVALAATAEERLGSHEATSYESLEATWATLARAGELWAANPGLPALREQTLSFYARAALDARDLKLARLQAGRLAEGQLRRELVAAIDDAEARITAQDRARRIARGALAAALAVIVGGSALFSYSLSRAKEQAIRDRDSAETARLAAETSRTETEELVGFMLGDMTESLRPIGKLAIMDSVLTKVNALLEKRAKEGLSPTERSSLVTLFINVALVRESQGKLDEADTAAAQALEVAKGLVAEEPENPICLSLLGESWSRIGAIRESQGRLDEAAEAHGKDLALREKLVAAEPDDETRQRAVAISWNRIGAILQAQGKLAEARTAFEKHRDIMEKLAAADPADAGRQRALAISWSRIGGILEAEGKLDEAVATYGKHRDILDKLATSDPANTGWQRDLGMAWIRIGGALQAQGRKTEARAAFEKVLAIREALATSDPSNAAWQNDLSVSWNWIGGMLEGEGKSDEARAAYERALAIRETLAASDPTNAGWQRGLGASWNAIGGLLESQGKLDDARAAYEKSLTINEELAESDPTNTAWLRGLSGSWNRIGGIFDAQGNLDEARAALEKALAISEKLAASDPGNTGWQSDLSVAWIRVADTLESQEKLPEARTALEKAIAIGEKLTASDPTNAEWRRNLSIAYRNHGSVVLASGEDQLAESSIRKAIDELSEEANERDPSTDIRILIARNREVLARLHAVRGNTTEADSEWSAALKWLDSINDSKDRYALETRCRALVGLQRTEDARAVAEQYVSYHFSDALFLKFCRASGLLSGNQDLHR